MGILHEYASKNNTQKDHQKIFVLLLLCLFLFACVQNQFVQRKKQLCHYFWPLDTDTYMNAIDNNYVEMYCPSRIQFVQARKETFQYRIKRPARGQETRSLCARLWWSSFGGHVFFTDLFLKLHWVHYCFGLKANTQCNQIQYRQIQRKFVSRKCISASV